MFLVYVSPLGVGEQDIQSETKWQKLSKDVKTVKKSKPMLLKGMKKLYR